MSQVRDVPKPASYLPDLGRLFLMGTIKFIRDCSGLGWVNSLGFKLMCFGVAAVLCLGFVFWTIASGYGIGGSGGVGGDCGGSCGGCGGSCGGGCGG